MKPYRIGYTTGVFDMFHVGHLNILKKAKEQCDRLVVGVSTDELVATYKNKIPLIPFEERMEIVRAIKYVDEVVAQTTMDKLEAYERLHFDAMFHGDDWKGSAMYNDIEKKFKELGVALVFIPHTDGVSSSMLQEKIKKLENK